MGFKLSPNPGIPFLSRAQAKAWEVSCIGQSLRENHATFAHAEKLRNSLFRASLPCSGEFFYPLDLEKTPTKFPPPLRGRIKDLKLPNPCTNASSSCIECLMAL